MLKSHPISDQCPPTTEIDYLRLIHEDIRDMRGEITAMRGEITAMRGEINGLGGEVKNIQQSISKIPEDIRAKKTTTKSKSKRHCQPILVSPSHLEREVKKKVRLGIEGASVRKKLNKKGEKSFQKRSRR